jgi:tetratricopeptide (TPR) repeat protein
LKHFFFGGICIFLLLSCSTKKNTAITRTYHNTTSRFNILFNGKESFKKATRAIETEFNDDYTQILPIFTHGDKELNKSRASDFEVALKKTSKLITMHSITVKPEIKSNKPMSAAEKAFYDKNEFNKWVDENYLLMGKAHFYNGDYTLAKETFRYILRHFPNEEIVYPTQIWLARTLSENKEYRDANVILSELEFDTKLPKKLKGDLYTTLADYHLKLKAYDKAAEYLKEALEYTRKKAHKARYNFILAQLMVELEQYREAREYYKMVIRLNPPYKMAFQAKINSALAYDSATGRANDLKSELRKMLKDDKNIEFQDQIYYALGNIEYKQDNLSEAIDLYEESIVRNLENTDQRALSFLTLADIYYDEQSYLESQAYYDSAVSIITSDYPEYTTIYNRSVSLNKLALHSNTFHLQDSVLQLSKLSTSELNAVIDKIIAKVNEEEKRKQEEEARKREEAQYAQEQQMLSNRLNIADANSSWYFYNTAAKTDGIVEFRGRWGNRKLEDNWRRINKSSGDFNAFNTEAEEVTTTVDSAKQKLSVKSRDYYMIDIPFSDSMKEEAHKKIERALFNMGLIYRTDLNDYQQAIKSYEELLRRYPKSEFELSTYYNLYDLYKEIDKPILVQAYRNKILAEYPDSRIALIISDPDFARKILEEENKVNRLYEETYNYFTNSQYSRVLSNTQYAISEFPEHPIIPQFELLRALSIGYTSATSKMEGELKQLMKKYPEHEVSKQAQRVLAFIKNPTKPEEAMEQVEAEMVEVAYSTPRTREQHVFVFIIKASDNVNQLVFNVINFNLDNYERQNFQSITEGISEKYNAVLVKSFKTKTEAINYSNAILENEAVFRDVAKENIFHFVMSTQNYQIMKSSGVPESYNQFFEKYY